MVSFSVLNQIFFFLIQGWKLHNRLKQYLNIRNRSGFMCFLVLFSKSPSLEFLIMSVYHEITLSTSRCYHTSTGYTLRSIDTQEFSQLKASLTNAINSLQTATSLDQVTSLSRVIRGSEASLSIISAENVLATATNTFSQAQETKVILDATQNIEQLTSSRNFYGYDLSPGGNGIFLALFGMILLFYILLTFRSRYVWFNLCFICGYGIETLGYTGRILSLKDNCRIGIFALQNCCLITAPAFIMAGIYFIFSQTVTIYGEKYSLMSPMWYSHFFITIDVFSFFLQTLGEGLSAMADSRTQLARAGNIIMFVGVILQIIAMSTFIFFGAHFISCVYFRDRELVNSDSPYKNKNLKNFFKLIFNVESARDYKHNLLDLFYNTRYQGIRLRPLFSYLPLAIGVSVLIIYIRCIYRVVELKQGHLGYLMQHEAFLFTLDSSMIIACGLVFIPFHPLFVFGRDNVVKLVNIRDDLESAFLSNSIVLAQNHNHGFGEVLVSSQNKSQKDNPSLPLYMF